MNVRLTFCQVDVPSPLAQPVALRYREQEVAGSIPGSANILSED